VSAPAFPKIDSPSVSAMRIPEQSGQAVFLCGYNNQVNMIGHQAIGPYIDICFYFGIRKQANIGSIVGIGEESLLTSIPTLRNVVRVMRDNYPRHPGHGVVGLV
jgi:hypothetical protein